AVLEDPTANALKAGAVVLPTVLPVPNAIAPEAAEGDGLELMVLPEPKAKPFIELLVLLSPTIRFSVKGVVVETVLASPNNTFPLTSIMPCFLLFVPIINACA